MVIAGKFIKLSCAAMVALALYQPDMPQNVGSMVRLAACFGVPLHVVEPCGFPFDLRRLRRTALDYAEHADIHRHASWEAFRASASRPAGRLVLFSTRAATSMWQFAMQPSDTLLFGQESCGVPEAVHQAADARVFIPIRPETRSLNVAQAAAVALSYALHTTRSS